MTKEQIIKAKYARIFEILSERCPDGFALFRELNRLENAELEKIRSSKKTISILRRCKLLFSSKKTDL